MASEFQRPDLGCDVVRLPSHGGAVHEDICEASSTVERVNQYPLYELGKVLRTLADRVELDEQPATKIYLPIMGSLRALDALLKGAPFPLGISKTATAELRAEIYSIYAKNFTETDASGKRKSRWPEESDILYSWDISGIKPKLDKFETLLSTEMSESATYFVPARGIFSTAALIDVADKSFPMEISGFVPEKAKEDWRAAGRCLAFSLFSASGFHAARAVEATMEAYYQLFLGKPGKILRSWDEYHKELSKIVAANPNPTPQPKTLIEFDQMRQDYRNPIAHPRVSLTEADARVVFNNGESLIILMASEIKTIREAGGVQGSLAVVGGSSIDADIPF
jgi:hypothetical protein